jgi:hypothetical protein
MAAFKCPSCPVTFTWILSGQLALGVDSAGRHLRVESAPCPGCQRWSLRLIATTVTAEGAVVETDPLLIWPRATNRPPCPPEVPANICGDYREACLVLADSPKASAALSRRCLQQILRDGAKVKHANLSDEIDQVLASKRLHSSIARSLDAVREIGNFAAHPTKSLNTGEIMDVEPGEADWNLDVVEALMDIYFVQPVTMDAKMTAINAKLAEAGRPPLPKPTEP